MPVTDPIADLLTRMRNAQKARHEQCRCPWSRHKEEICNALKKAGFVSTVVVDGEGKNKEIVIEFSEEHPALTIERVSKPGRRVYTGKSDLRPVLQGFGIAVVSTSKGIMTDIEAKKTGVGGEVLCTIS